MRSFEQAVIKVEKEKEFGEVKGAIEGAFRPEQVEKFLKRVQGKSLPIRDLDSILAQKVFDHQTAAPGTDARGLYQSLTLSDQAQMREFYLFKVEEVSPELR